MKKLFLPLVLVLCLLLAACGNNHTESENNNNTDDQVETNQPVEPVEPDDTDTPEDEGPVTLGALTVEVVMDWESADALLSQLEDLSAKLDEALVAQGYDANPLLSPSAQLAARQRMPWLPAAWILRCCPPRTLSSARTAPSGF